MDKKLRGKFKVFYFDYPTQSNNRFGAGGWSKNAQRPRPVIKCHELSGKQIEFYGKSVILDTVGAKVRKLKCTIIRANNPKEIIREDYPLNEIVALSI